MTDRCHHCDRPATPVWATIVVEPTAELIHATGLADPAFGGQPTGVWKLPLWACDREHLSAWRPIDTREESNDFMDNDVDWVRASTVEPPTSPRGVSPPTPVGRSWWRFWRPAPEDDPACLRCSAPVALAPTGQRWECRVVAPVRGTTLDIQARLDLPVFGCAACGQPFRWGDTTSDGRWWPLLGISWAETLFPTDPTDPDVDYEVEVEPRWPE